MIQEPPLGWALSGVDVLKKKEEYLANPLDSRESISAIYLLCDKKITSEGMGDCMTETQLLIMF